MKNTKVVCFGEILWDVFPDRKSIGGAPLNVALRLNSFGVHASIISSVGTDDDGENALKFIRDNGIATDTIQTNRELRTGLVEVTLDSKGSATYEIKYPVAWDKVAYSSDIVEVVRNSDAFVFGSLACRDEVSQKTLLKLLDKASFKVFDVNLRAPHYSCDLIFELMQKADFVKLNDEELLEICNYLNYTHKSIEQMISFLSVKIGHIAICVTKGGEGATLLWNGQFYDNKGYTVKVKDTVGAGDSFLASLIFKLLSNEKPSKALNFACVIGSLVASKEGANAFVDQEEIDNLIMFH